MTEQDWNDTQETLGAIRDAFEQGVAEEYSADDYPVPVLDPDYYPADDGYDEMTPEEAAAQLGTTVEQMVHEYATPYLDQLQAHQEQQQVAAASQEADAIVAQHAERLGVELDSEQAKLDVGAAAFFIADSLQKEGLAPAEILAQMETNGTVEALFQWAAEKQMPARGDEHGLVAAYFPNAPAMHTPTAAGAADEFGLVSKYFSPKGTQRP
jgi:hypothetical protein